VAGVGTTYGKRKQVHARFLCGNRLDGIPRRRCESNIKMILNRLGVERMGLGQVARFCGQGN
jgi:hypothetical protein